MADPSSITQGDWLSAIVAFILAAFGILMGWIKSRTKDVNDRLDCVEQNVGKHDTHLAVMQTCQVNTSERLVEIKQAASESNEKLDRLSEALTQVLIAIKGKR